jgi:hypothetical protein
MLDEAVKSPENAVFAICQTIISVSYSDGIRKFRLFTGPSYLADVQTNLRQGCPKDDYRDKKKQVLPIASAKSGYCHPIDGHNAYCVGQHFHPGCVSRFIQREGP